MINKKIFKSLLYAIGLIFFIIYYFNEINKNIDDSCFDELITLKIDSIGVDLIDDFIFHLNEFDDLIEKSFKDYRYEHLLKLSLKNSNKHDLKKISELIKYPDIYYLIKTLNTQIQNQSNNNLIYYVSKINILLKRLVKYFNCEEIDKDIGLIIANDIIINEKYLFLDNENAIIKIIPTNDFHSYRSQEEYYDKLFILINNLNNEINIIEQVVVNNKLLFENFINNKDQNNSNMKINFYKSLILYSNNISDLYLHNNFLDNMFEEIQYESITNYITNESIVNEKFKTIRKISRNYSNEIFSYNDNAVDFSKALQESKFLITNINVNKKSNNVLQFNKLIDDCIQSFIILEDLINNNANRLKVGYLLQSYNQAMKINIDNYANAENVLFENVDANIKNMLFNEKNNKFITRIYDYKDSNEKNIRQLFK